MQTTLGNKIAALQTLNDSLRAFNEQRDAKGDLHYKLDEAYSNIAIRISEVATSISEHTDQVGKSPDMSAQAVDF